MDRDFHGPCVVVDTTFTPDPPYRVYQLLLSDDQRVLRLVLAVDDGPLVLLYGVRLGDVPEDMSVTASPRFCLCPREYLEMYEYLLDIQPSSSGERLLGDVHGGGVVHSEGVGAILANS